MLKKDVWLMTLFLPLLATSPASAQEPGAVGLTMGYPTAVGLVWQATSNIAIRPEFTVSRSSSESLSSSATGAKSSSWNVGGGASALFYVGGDAPLRTYLSPRVVFTHAETDLGLSGASAPASETTSNSYALSGSFGAQYMVGTRFSVYGEVGLAYTHASTKSAVSVNRPESTTWGTRSGVGVVLYF